MITFIHSFIHSFINIFNVEKTIVRTTNLYRQKKKTKQKIYILIKKSTLALDSSFYMNPNLPMYVLKTRHEHLGSTHSLMFCLKLTRELLISMLQIVVAIIVVFCMLQFQFCKAQSLPPDYRDPSNFLWYMGYFSAQISHLQQGNRPFRYMKISIISC